MKKVAFLLMIIFVLPMYGKFEFVSYKINGALDPKFIQELVKVFEIDIFFETGTYNGATTLNAIPYFEQLYTVELYEELYKRALERLSPYTNVHVYYGASPDVIREVAPTIHGKILFWLDAHYSGEGTALSFDDADSPEAVTAIRGELAAIKNAGIKNCVILIDDMRGFGTQIAGQEYMGCWAYPTIQEVQTELLKINPNFECVLLGDILLAYDKTSYHPEFSQVVIACTQTRLYDGYTLTDEQLMVFEENIKQATEHEKVYIKHLYDTMTNCKDPMFWHDLWHGLMAMGSDDYINAYQALSKIKIRTQHLNKKRKAERITIFYDHPRIDKYLAECIKNMC